jgi:phosphatidylethanolamine-binding protein (PEBP) family uncharacterized protein
MRRSHAVISCAMFGLALALAGCGSSADSSEVSTTIAPISFTSPVMLKHAIPAVYTCDGKDLNPPLEWGKVPSGTSELLVMVVGLKPNANATSFAVSAEWALAGISPTLRRLSPGQLPTGAHSGVATDGSHHYSICPAKGVNERYEFLLYAVPSSVTLGPNFEDISALALLSKPGTPHSGLAQGQLVALYKRR